MKATKVTVHDYKTGEIIGACQMKDFARYDAAYPAPSNPGAVRAGDWLSDDAAGSLGISQDLTVWFEEI